MGETTLGAKSSKFDILHTNKMLLYKTNLVFFFTINYIKSISIENKTLASKSLMA